MGLENKYKISTARKGESELTYAGALSGDSFFLLGGYRADIKLG